MAWAVVLCWFRKEIGGQLKSPIQIGMQPNLPMFFWETKHSRRCGCCPKVETRLSIQSGFLPLIPSRCGRFSFGFACLGQIGRRMSCHLSIRFIPGEFARGEQMLERAHPDVVTCLLGYLLIHMFWVAPGFLCEICAGPLMSS